MYPNFLSDRKYLGYEVLRDTNCGIKLVLIVDSTVVRLLKPSKCKRQFVSKVNRKSKIIIVVITLVSTLWFSNVEPSSAIGLSMGSAPVVRVQPSYPHDSKVQIAKVIARKKDLIVSKSPKEILFLMYLNDPRLSSNQEVLKLVKKLRGGSWGLLETAAFLGLIILIFSMREGFVFNNPNPG